MVRYPRFPEMLSNCDKELKCSSICLLKSLYWNIFMGIFFLMFALLFVV